MRSATDLRTYRMLLVAMISTLALFIAACGDQDPGDEVVEIEPTDPPEEPADDPEGEDEDDGADEGNGDDAADEGNGDDTADDGNGDDTADDGNGDDAADEGNGDDTADDGNGDEGNDEGADADTAGLEAEVELQVPGGEDGEESEDTEPVRYTLICSESAAIEDAEDDAGWIDEVGIDAGEACEEAEALLADPPEREPDTMCTQQYGGPHTATVTVTDGDDEATVDFSRTDGCEIDQWDSYDALLGEATVGAPVD